MKDIETIPAEWQAISKLFVALGDEQRQRILLAFEKGERLSILQVVESSHLSRTAVTHHLKILHQAGALECEKVGKTVCFWINKDEMSTAIENVLTYINNNL